MHKTSEKLIRGLLIFAAVYFLFEAMLYLFDIRLSGVKNAWPLAGITYSKYIERILGSMFLLFSIIAFEIQKDLNKYRKFVILSSYWAFFDGFLVLYLSTTQDFVKIYQAIPSLYVWFPWYNQFLYFEVILLIFYAVLVYLWKKNEK